MSKAKSFVKKIFKERKISWGRAKGLLEFTGMVNVLGFPCIKGRQEGRPFQEPSALEP